MPCRRSTNSASAPGRLWSLAIWHAWPLVEEFGNARSKGLGDDDLAKVAKAVVAGRVATLLIEARREVPGRINAATGDIEFDDLAHPEVDDVLDDLGALALKMGGQVVIVPRTDADGDGNSCDLPLLRFAGIERRTGAQRGGPLGR
jgi:hypothetical protein